MSSLASCLEWVSSRAATEALRDAWGQALEDASRDREEDLAMADDHLRDELRWRLFDLAKLIRDVPAGDLHQRFTHGFSALIVHLERSGQIESGGMWNLGAKRA